MNTSVLTTPKPARRGADPDVIKRAAALIQSGAYAAEGPQLLPCVCGEPRHVHVGRLAARPEHLQHRYRRDPADKMAEAAIAADRRSLRDTIAEYERKRRARKYGKTPRTGVRVSVSDVGRCRRQIMYREQGAATNPTMPTGAWVGSAIHDKAEAAAKSLSPWVLTEYEVDVPGLDRKARIDKYDPIMGVVDDTKSAGAATWERFGDEGPSPEMWEQVLTYCLILEQAGEYVAVARISPVERDKGRCETFSRPWDDEAREIAEQAMGRLLDTATALDNGDELPRDRSGPSTDMICKDYCPFRRVCWNEDAAEEAMRSPESFTQLGPDVDAEAAEWAIRQHVEAKGKKGDKKEIEKEIEQAKALLVGIEVGVYGDYYLRNGKSVSYDHKGQAAGLLEWAQTPAEERPHDLSIYAAPVKNTTWYPDTGKVRLARTKQQRDAADALDRLMRSGVRRQPAGFAPIRTADEEAAIIASVPDEPEKIPA